MDVESASEEAQEYLDNHPLTQSVDLSYRNKTTPKPDLHLPDHGGGKVGSFASGLDFVPRDEFPAYLHYGEAVLTRKEADVWRKGNGNAILAAKLDQLQEVMAQALGRPMVIQIDGRTLAAVQAKENSRSIGNRNIQTLMGMGG